MNHQQFEELMKTIVASNEKVLSAVLNRERQEQTGNIMIVPSFETFDSNKKKLQTLFGKVPKFYANKRNQEG
jgi:hypothetical protein